MKGGYVGKILTINLTTGDIREDGLLDERVLRNYIGCWGLGLKLLYDMLPPGYTAIDPETPLIFMTGPLTGLPLPAATNLTLATKNFDTGITVGRSHTHGVLGINLKQAGYDGVIITGQADSPCYLYIHDGQVEIQDASNLWGKDTHEAEDILKQELRIDKGSVAAIGPAGENLCAGALISNDKNHQFSHSGVGSVMGSKKLKALAIRGDKPIPVFDVDEIRLIAGEWRKRLASENCMGKYMTGQVFKQTEYRRMLDKCGFAGKNMQINQLSEFGLGWGRQKWTLRPCPGCPIACSYDLEVTEGPYKGYVATLTGGGEALEAAGSLLNITEPGAIFYLTDLYDRLGIEGSTCGCTIAMAIEAYEKGLISKKETDGLELRWGDPGLAEKLIRKYAYREGFGDVLARGPKEAAKWIGGDAPDFAINVKGAGINLHDWRGGWGNLFGQIIGSGAGWPAPGADTWAAEPDFGFPDLTDHFDHTLKPLEVRNTGIGKFMEDCIGICWFATWGLPGVLDLASRAISAATGRKCSPEELVEVGERVMHLERAFNIRHGLTPDDDHNVPKRLVEAPQDGRAAGLSIAPHLQWMIDEYYKLMGWDAKTGKPMRKTLERFDLAHVARDLWG